jgi:predicted ArsR family transcriptional regulator
MMKTDTSSASLSTAIVTTLKRYGGPIPIDFLAGTMGRRTSEIKKHLESLRQRGVIKFEDNKVGLASER